MPTPPKHGHFNPHPHHEPRTHRYLRARSARSRQRAPGGPPVHGGKPRCTTAPPAAVSYTSPERAAGTRLAPWLVLRPSRSRTDTPIRCSCGVSTHPRRAHAARFGAITRLRAGSRRLASRSRRNEVAHQIGLPLACLISGSQVHRGEQMAVDPRLAVGDVFRPC